MENLVSIDIYMKEINIFPNTYMGEAEKITQMEDKIYDIYWILLGDKYEICDMYSSGAILNVIVRNCKKNTKYVVRLDTESFMEVPNTSYLKIYLRDNNSVLYMEYNDKGVEFIKKHNKIRFREYENVIQEGNKYYWGIHAKNLADAQLKADGIDFSLEYEVMYIGQSKKDNIFERLNNHSTLQKIMRDTIRTTRENEIYVMVHSVGVKIFNKLQLDDYNASIVFGNTLERNFTLDDIVDNNAIINIAEAMLISHFKPSYNDKLKKDDGVERLATYRKVGETNINPIKFSLDLYWGEFGEKMMLYTDVTRTETKGRVLTCCFNEGKVEFSKEDIPD